MTVTTFDPSEGPSEEQLAAEANALAQGEKIIQAQEEAKAKQFEDISRDEEDLSLIGGKFKSQDDLLKAYEELQKKLGNSEPEEEEEPVEEQEEVVEEAPEEEETEAFTETVTYMSDLGRQFDEKGELAAEDIEKLGAMDSNDLIKAYLAYTAKAKSATLHQTQVDSIMDSVGGAAQYADMVQWAGENLSPEEVADFNAVTATNNAIAIKFAVQSLSSKYQKENGYEAPLVSGKAPSSTAKGYRSHAELSRAIADPRYSTDPAYRSDVEARLARSKDLL